MLQNNSISARLYLRFALETIWTEQINGLPSRESSEPSTFPQTDFHRPMSDAIAGSENIFIHEGISYALFPDETVWRDKQKMLQERGYLLRPRFRPGWVHRAPTTNIFTHEGISYALFPDETVWRDKQKMLEERGYLLRPRFRPGWVPSWLNTNKRPLLCEDSLYNPVRPSSEYSS